MGVIIPTSVEALREAVLKDNPVNIAGYGHESTHRGYLMHLFNRPDVGLAASVLRSLYSRAFETLPGFLSRDPDKICCCCEQPLGNRRRVDLLVKWGDHKLPIELKVDSC